MTRGGRRLRAVRPEDFDSIGAFWARAWAPVYPEIDFCARLPWLKRHLVALVARGVDVVVALDERDAPCALVTIDPKDGHLDQLCVAPSEKGHGLAGILLNEAKRRAPGEIILDVNDRNVRAMAFYAREGFVRIGAGISAAGHPTTKMRWRAAV